MDTIFYQRVKEMYNTLKNYASSTSVSVAVDSNKTLGRCKSNLFKKEPRLVAQIMQLLIVKYKYKYSKSSLLELY
jgi:hypothetical protein